MKVDSYMERDKIRIVMEEGDRIVINKLFSYEEVNTIVNELSFSMYCIDGIYDDMKTVDDLVGGEI
jgi:hypothetical protein